MCYFVCVCWWRYQSKQSQGRIGMLRRTGEKRMLSAWSAHTHTNTHTPIHTYTNIPSLLSVMASALTVCVARSFEATTTRHNTVYLGNSLPLHHSLLLCTSLFRSLSHISAPSLSSLTMTLRKPWENFCLHSFLTKVMPSLSLSFPPIANQQKRQQPHAQKLSIFNFSPLFHVVSEKDVSKQEPWGG